MSWFHLHNCALLLTPDPLRAMKAPQSSIGLYRRSSTAWAMTRVQEVSESPQSYSVKKRSANGTTLLDPTLTQPAPPLEDEVNGQSREGRPVQFDEIPRGRQNRRVSGFPVAIGQTWRRS